MRGVGGWLALALLGVATLWRPAAGDEFMVRFSEPELDHVPPGFEDEDFDDVGGAGGGGDGDGEDDLVEELVVAMQGATMPGAVRNARRVPRTLNSLPDIARLLVEAEIAGKPPKRERPSAAATGVVDPRHGPDVPPWAAATLASVTSPNFAEYMQPEKPPVWGVARLLWESMKVANAAPGVRLAFDRIWERLPIVRGRVTFGVKLSSAGVINRWEAYFYHRALEQEQLGTLLPTGQDDPQCPIEQTAQEDIVCQLPALCPVTAHYPPAAVDAGGEAPASAGCIFDHMCNSLIIHRDTAVVSVDILNGTGRGSVDGVLPDEIGFYNCSLQLPGHFKRGDGWRVAKLNVTEFTADASRFIAPLEAHGGPDYHWMHGTWHPPSVPLEQRSVWNLEALHSLGDVRGLPLPRSRHTAPFKPVRLQWEGDGLCFCPTVEMLDPFFEPSSVFTTLRMELTQEQIDAAWNIMTKWTSWTVCVGRKWSQPYPNVQGDEHAAEALAAAAAGNASAPATADGRLPVVYINWQGLSASEFGAYLEDRGFPAALREHYDAHMSLYEGNFFEVHEAHVAPPGSGQLYYERAGFHGTV